MKTKTPIYHFLSTLLFIAIFLAQTGCVRFYHLKDVGNSHNYDVDSEIRKANYKFVHIGNKVIQVSNLGYDSNAKTLIGNKVKTDEVLLSIYKNANKNGRNKRFKVKSNTDDYSQLHIITSHLDISSQGIVTIKVGDILETQLLKHDKAASTAGDIGVVTLITGAGVGIFLAIVCNCPHVYVLNGEKFERSSNAFVGSVSPQLEATDYSVLQNNHSENVKINIMNEDTVEKQYINEVKLLHVSHSNKVKIMTDQSGNIYTINNPIPPLQKSLLSLTEKRDNLTYEFNTLSEKSDLSELELTFPIIGNSKQSKLVLSAKNSYWASYVMKEWYQLFGSEINNIREKNEKVSANKQLNWQKEQGIRMSIYINEKGTWVFQKSVNVIGNTVFKDFVIPIDLSKIQEDQVKVKLVSGYKLWELDYAAIDFSENEAVSVKELSPSKIILNDSTISNYAINDDDTQYETMTFGSTLSLEFNKTQNKESESSTNILKLKGYYSKNSNQQGDYKKRELLSFRKKAQMSRYSYYLMQTMFSELVNN